MCGMKSNLNGKRIAILVADGFEQIELTSPQEALKKSGAETVIVSPKKGSVQGYHHEKPGDQIKVDLSLNDVQGESFDGLLLPGGVKNPDTLRMEPKAVEFVRSFFNEGKPIAAICHGPWMLVEADVVRGREVTSYPSVKTDLTNAGARWKDEAVVTDEGIVTSRTPDDLPQFNEKMVEEFAEGKHERRTGETKKRGKAEVVGASASKS